MFDRAEAGEVRLKRGSRWDAKRSAEMRPDERGCQIYFRFPQIGAGQWEGVSLVVIFGSLPVYPVSLAATVGAVRNRWY